MPSVVSLMAVTPCSRGQLLVDRDAREILTDFGLWINSAVSVLGKNYVQKVGLVASFYSQQSAKHDRSGKPGGFFGRFSSRRVCGLVWRPTKMQSRKHQRTK